MSNLYVYAIARKFDFPDITGIEEEQIFLVLYKDIAAVVSKRELEEIDPTRQNVKSHVRVQEQLMMLGTIVPLSFGTIVPDELIEKLLEKNYSLLSGELEKLADTIEVEVKITWNRELLLSELDRTSSYYSRLRKKLDTTTSPLQKQEIILEIGRVVEKTVQNWKTTYAKRIFDALRSISRETKENSVSRIEVLMDISFLINRHDEESFLSLLKDLDKGTDGRLDFKYIGPLPPYNFLKINLAV